MATMFTLSGTLKEVVENTIAHLDYGYKIATEWSEIDWPYFWRRKYFVNMYRQEPQAQQLGIYVNGQFVAASNPMLWPPPYPVEVTKKGPSVTMTFEGLFKPDHAYLKWELERAIENEDYEEAARIRDLINKQ